MTEFDDIVVGAGVAGSVLAARLSEASGATVALIEAGGENPVDIGRSQGALFLTWAASGTGPMRRFRSLGWVTGWNGAAAIEVFRRVERTDRGPDDLRGRSGPIVLQDISTPTDLSERLRDAFVEAGLG